MSQRSTKVRPCPYPATQPFASALLQAVGLPSWLEAGQENTRKVQILSAAETGPTHLGSLIQATLPLLVTHTLGDLAQQP